MCTQIYKHECTHAHTPYNINMQKKKERKFLTVYKDPVGGIDPGRHSIEEQLL